MLPSPWSTRRVIETYTRRDGTPGRGRVLFVSPTVYVVDGVTVVPKVLVAELDDAGRLDLEVPTQPGGVVYAVREEVSGLPRAPFSFLHQPGAEPAVLDQQAPVVPPSEVVGLVPQVTETDVPLGPDGVWRALLGYSPDVDDPNVYEVRVLGALSGWINERGLPRAAFTPGGLSDALFRGVDHANATGWFLEHQNAARDQSLFGVRHDGSIWRTVLGQLYRLAELGSDAAHVSLTGPEMYGVKLLTTPPELCISGSSSTPGSQTIQGVKVWVHQAVTVEAIAAYVRTVIGTADPAGIHGYAIYADIGSDTLTRVGVTVDDPTLFGTAAWREKALSAPVALLPKRAYWLAFLTAYSTGSPVFASTQATSVNPLTNALPGGRTAISWTAQTTFPATLSKAAGAATSVRFCMYGR